MTIFNKQSNPAQSESVSTQVWWGGTLSGNQYIYQLIPSGAVWHENRDLGHTNYGVHFGNIIESLGYGLNTNEFYPGSIVLANSSTANSPTESIGSQTRSIDDTELYWIFAQRQWREGYLFFCPEHQDYDEKDWFKINNPYRVVSQGSSGSEGEELLRCLAIIRAIRSEVLQWMVDNKRVGDILTYLMRSNRFGGYLDPMVHQPVVNNWSTSQADLDLASSLTLDTIPPTLKIIVLSDSLDQRNQWGQPITTYVRTDEVVGLKRIDGAKERVLEVELVGNKPGLTYHWIKVQGESSISFPNIGNTRATITIPLQSNISVLAQDGHTTISNRVDICAVAHDGLHYSSPIFISEYITPEARNLMSRINEIGVTADNSFICKINGVENFRGNNWQSFVIGAVDWVDGENLVEISVINEGGPGGLLINAFVGEQEYGSDGTWEVSRDGISWSSASVLGSHGMPPWGPISGIKPNTKAQWIWMSGVPENVSLSFRKIIVKGESHPLPDTELETLRAELNALKAAIRLIISAADLSSLPSLGFCRVG